MVVAQYVDHVVVWRCNQHEFLCFRTISFECAFNFFPGDNDGLNIVCLNLIQKVTVFDFFRSGRPGNKYLIYGVERRI